MTAWIFLWSFISFKYYLYTIFLTSLYSDNIIMRKYRNRVEGMQQNRDYANIHLTPIQYYKSVFRYIDSELAGYINCMHKNSWMSLIWYMIGLISIVCLRPTHRSIVCIEESAVVSSDLRVMKSFRSQLFMCIYTDYPRFLIRTNWLSIDTILHVSAIDDLMRNSSVYRC